MSAAFIAYASPFTSHYRNLIESIIIEQLKLNDIPYNLTIKSYLTTPALLQSWHLKALPKDDHSIQNAIILHQAINAPFLIDPQNQAMQFIIQSGAELIK